ncbi:MAG: phosphate/phosphite/phosphonate ABC transporter substrate-binding protein [Myxococcota bacterium]
MTMTICAVGCDDDGSTGTGPPVSALHFIEGGTERPEKLVVGLTPFLPESTLKREFEPLIRHIGKELGIPTEVRRAESYADVSRLLKTYQIHFAVLSPFAYVQAKRQNPGLILLATQIADGSSTYAGYIVARDDSGINAISDLKGKRFLYVDRNSASGYLYPIVYLRSLGHDPERFFSSLEFAGNHTAVIKSVLGRRADGGAVSSVVYRMALIEEPEGKHLAILAKTGRIPHDAYCASPRLDQRMVNHLRSILLNLSTRTEEGRHVLRGLTSINGFVAVGDDHYDEVRRVARLVEEGTLGAP